MNLDQYGGRPARHPNGQPRGHSEFTELCLAMTRTLTQLPALHAELTARALDANDAYPKNSLGGTSRPSSDADGQPLPDYNDPTGTASTTTPDTDPDGATLIDAWTTATHLDKELRSLHGRLTRKLRPPPRTTDGPLADHGCRNCARTKIEHPDGKRRARYVPTHDAGLCEFCFSYQQAQGCLPGTETLRNWHATGKCTDRDIERDLRAEERRRTATRGPSCGINPLDDTRPETVEA